MKKHFFLSMSALTIAFSPAIVAVSCGQKTTNDITIEEDSLQIQVLETNEHSYPLVLKSELESNQSLWVQAKINDSSSGVSINEEHTDITSIISGKDVLLPIKLLKKTPLETNDFVSFKLTFTCKQNEDEIWSKTIDNFKLEYAHAITLVGESHQSVKLANPVCEYEFLLHEALPQHDKLSFSIASHSGTANVQLVDNPTWDGDLSVKQKIKLISDKGLTTSDTCNFELLVKCNSDDQKWERKFSCEIYVFSNVKPISKDIIAKDVGNFGKPYSTMKFGFNEGALPDNQTIALTISNQTQSGGIYKEKNLVKIDLGSITLSEDRKSFTLDVIINEGPLFYGSPEYGSSQVTFDLKITCKDGGETIWEEEVTNATITLGINCYSGKPTIEQDTIEWTPGEELIVYRQSKIKVKLNTGFSVTWLSDSCAILNPDGEFALADEDYNMSLDVNKDTHMLTITLSWYLLDPEREPLIEDSFDLSFYFIGNYGLIDDPKKGPWFACGDLITIHFIALE